MKGERRRDKPSVPLPLQNSITEILSKKSRNLDNSHDTGSLEIPYRKVWLKLEK